MRKVLLVITLLAMLVVGCGKKTVSAPEPVDTVVTVESTHEEIVESDYTELIAIEPTERIDLGGPLNSWKYMSDYDYHFTYNGAEYHFPMMCTDFVTDAFKVDGDLMEAVEPGSTNYFIAYDGDAEFNVGVVNKSDESLPTKECNLLSVRVTSYPWEDINVDFVGPDGTALGNSYSRLLGDNLPAALDDKVEDGDGLVMVIENDDSGYCIGVISYDYAEDKCGQIFIEYYGE